MKTKQEAPIKIPKWFKIVVVLKALLIFCGLGLAQDLIYLYTQRL